MEALISQKRSHIVRRKRQNVPQKSRRDWFLRRTSSGGHFPLDISLPGNYPLPQTINLTLTLTLTLILTLLTLTLLILP